jgi:hypothetical protein
MRVVLVPISLFGINPLFLKNLYFSICNVLITELKKNTALHHFSLQYISWKIRNPHQQQMRGLIAEFCYEDHIAKLKHGMRQMTVNYASRAHA